MTPAALLTRFREEMRDEVAPYLWSDSECYSYMDRAQKDFCRYTGGIADITTVSLVASTSTYSVSSRILKIEYVSRTSDDNEVALINIGDIASGAYSLNDDEGTVEAILTDVGTDEIRCIPVPSATDTLSMVIKRMPLTDIDAGGDTLEIPEHHQIHLISGMAYYAHRKQDAETFDRERANQYLQTFLAYCDRAKAEREKREHKPRLMAYGGL